MAKDKDTKDQKDPKSGAQGEKHDDQDKAEGAEKKAETPRAKAEDGAHFRSRYAGYAISVEAKGAKHTVQFANNTATVKDPAVAAALRGHEDCGEGRDFWPDRAA